MKKIAATWVVLLLIAALLAGCTAAPAAPTTEPATEPAGTTEAVPTEEDQVTYELVTDDRSVTDENGNKLLDFHYQYVVLSGGDPVVTETINAKLKADSDAFMAENPTADYPDWKQMAAMYGDVYEDTANSEVTYLQNGILSIVTTTSWFMGGVFNGDHNGYVFDLTTGEALTLPELMDTDSETAEAQLKQIAWNDLSAQQIALMDDAKDILDQKPLDEFEFAVVNGEIVLYFAEYELADGASGALTVKTGINI